MRSHTLSFRCAIAACIALSATRTAGAQADSPRPPNAPAVAPEGITLEAALASARHRNADILIATSVIDSAKAERRISRAFPNPVLAGTPNTPYQYAASIPLDFTPQRVFRTRVATIGIAASEADRYDVVRQTAFAVAVAFFDALLAEEKLRSAIERRDGVRQVLLADSVRVRSGDIPQRSLVRSEVELARADADAARSSLDVATTRTALQVLMGLDRPDTAVRAIGVLSYQPLNFSNDSLVQLALRQRPDLRAQSERIAQSEQGAHLATALLFPTPELSFVRQYTAPFESGHFYSFGVSFELPSVNLYAGQRDRANAGVAAAQLARHRGELKVRQEVTTAVASFGIQRSLVERYQSGLLSKVDEAVAGAEYAYARGATSLLDVLDALRARQDVRADYYAALHDYWVAAYAINAATGSDPASVPRT